MLRGGVGCTTGLCPAVRSGRVRGDLIIRDAISKESMASNEDMKGIRRIERGRGSACEYIWEKIH